MGRNRKPKTQEKRGVTVSLIRGGLFESEDPIDDDTLFDALENNLSPQTVAAIIAYLQPAKTNNPDVDRQVTWFRNNLVDLVGGDDAFSRLCEELGL